MATDNFQSIILPHAGITLDVDSTVDQHPRWPTIIQNSRFPGKIITETSVG